MTTRLPAPAWQTHPWLWILGLGLAAIPFVFLYGRGPVVIDDVEWALLEGRMRRGARLARRLVAKNPNDPNAVFLYGVATLRQNPNLALVARVEALAKNIPRAKRTGIAYVLAIAAKELADQKRIRRWALEASQEPLLRARLAADDVWPAAAKSGRTRAAATPLQTGYA